MTNTTNRGGIRARWTWLSLAILLCVSGWVQAREDKFDVLKTRTKVYTNVTVTSMSKTDVYIFHSTGICNLKLADLPPETIQQLNHTAIPQTAGSGPPSTDEEVVNQNATVSETTSAQGQLNTQLTAQLLKLRAVGGTLIIGILVFAFLVYLFFCYCFGLICKKTGEEPGILIWLPILQLLPLLRAAGMSPLWILAWLVPGLNLIANIIWCVNITKAREKAPWVAILLILPVTNLFALLYLAFSNGESSKDEPFRTKPINPEPMVLEAN